VEINLQLNFIEELELIDEVYPRIVHPEYLDGNLQPVFFWLSVK
jgi:peptide subunit release factor RF-3